MSDIFGGGGQGDNNGGSGPSAYDIAQDSTITTIQNTIAGSNVDLNPIIARLDIIDADQVIQNTNISNNTSSIASHTTSINSLQSQITAAVAVNTTQTSDIAARVLTSVYDAGQLVQDQAIVQRLLTSTYNIDKAAQDTINSNVASSIANKLDTSVYNSFISSYNTAEANQDSRLTLLEQGNTTGVSQGQFNTYVDGQADVNDALNAAILTKLDTSVYNAYTVNQTGIDNAQDAAINSKVSQSTYDTNKTNTDAAIASKVNTTTFTTFVSNQNNIDSLQDAQLVLLETSVSNKLDTSLYTSDKLLTDAAISFLNSSLNANDTLTASIDTRVGVLEARTYPQTATQTPINSIVGVSGTNVQAALASLQTNINNVVVSGGGLSPYVNTQLAFIDTQYLTNPKFTGSALKWHLLNRIDQDLSSNTTGTPNWPRLGVVSGNGTTTNLDSTIAFSVFGNDNGNNDSRCLALYKSGRLMSENKFFIGGPSLKQWEISRDGIQLKTTATLSSCDGGASANYNDLIIKSNAISLTRLTQLENLQLPSLILNVPNQTAGIDVFNVFSSEGSFYPLSITNQGRLRIRHTDGNPTLIVSPNEALTLKGYGLGGIADSVVFQVNAPADSEARVQMFNNGRLRLWGSARANGANPAVDTTTSGDMILQGTLTCPTVSAGTVNATNYNGSSASFNSLIVNGIGIDGSVNWKVNDSIFLHNTVSTDLLNLNRNVSIIAGGLNNFGGQLPTTVIGQNLEVRCMSKSVIIGNNNLVYSLTQNQSNAAAICIGDSHVMQNVKTGVQLINIGFENEMNSVSTQDNSYRICLGSSNSVRGTSSIVIGTFNNINETNPLGAITGHTCLGINWKASYGVCNGTVIGPRENSIFIGNSLNSGDMIATFGGNSLPVADFDQLGQCQTINIQWARGNTNAKGTLCRVPSARKYKKDIKPFDYDINEFLKLRTVAHNGKLRGLIADDVNEIDEYKYLVETLNGEVEGLNYSGFVVPLISVVQQQQKEIDELKNKVKDMLSFKTLLDAQDEKINTLIETIKNMMKLE